MREKESSVRETFFLPQTLFHKSQWWSCIKMSSKLGAQSLQQSNGEQVQDHSFTGIGLIAYGKKRWFWSEKMENEFERKRERIGVS